MGNPAQVGFDNTGRTLVVTERFVFGRGSNSAFDLYRVDPSTGRVSETNPRSLERVGAVRVHLRL